MSEVKLNLPWSELRSETWIDGIKRAVRSRPESDIRRMLPLTPENVLALIIDGQSVSIKALEEVLEIAEKAEVGKKASALDRIEELIRVVLGRGV